VGGVPGALAGPPSRGADARAEELDGLIAANLASGWSLVRLDKPMKAILRAGAYELAARADVLTMFERRIAKLEAEA